MNIHFLFNFVYLRTSNLVNREISKKCNHAINISQYKRKVKISNGRNTSTKKMRNLESPFCIQLQIPLIFFNQSLFVANV